MIILTCAPNGTTKVLRLGLIEARACRRSLQTRCWFKVEQTPYFKMNFSAKAGDCTGTHLGGVFCRTALTSWGILYHALAHQMKKPRHPHSHNTLRRCKIIITSLQSVITVLNKNMTSNELCVPLSKISMRTHKDPSHPFTPLIGRGGCPFVTAMNEMSIQSSLMSPTMVWFCICFY